MKELIIYSRLSCVYCNEAKSLLDNNQIKYTEINIDHDTESRNWLSSNGYTSLPVLLVDGKPLVPGGMKSLRTMNRQDIISRLE